MIQIDLLPISHLLRTNLTLPLHQPSHVPGIVPSPHSTRLSFYLKYQPKTPAFKSPIRRSAKALTHLCTVEAALFKSANPSWAVELEFAQAYGRLVPRNSRWVASLASDLLCLCRGVASHSSRNKEDRETRQRAGFCNANVGGIVCQGASSLRIELNELYGDDSYELYKRPSLSFPRVHAFTFN